jgi:protein phosphatase
MISVLSCAITGAGKVRPSNQDNYFINGTIRKGVGTENEIHSENTKAEEYICAVFDGMGGEKSGDVASFLCARALQECFDKNGTDIDEYINCANGLICGLSEQIHASCGSTMALVRISRNFADIYNIGDSRIYHFTDGNLRMLSVDHTAAQSLVNIGVLTPDEAKTDSRRHTLTRHLGVSEEEMLPEAHTEKVNIKKGDKFILCTDGVTENLEDSEIWESLKTFPDIKLCADAIYESALSKGGKDNITIIIAEII